jgi:ADP-ribose pyrophosphatase
MKPFTIISETIDYQDGDRLFVIKTKLLTPAGKQVEWKYTRLKEGVIVLPMDDDGNVYLKKEWRFNRKGFLWELPSGWAEKEKPTKADLRDAANRELQEEVGLKSHNLTHLISFYPTNHICSQFHIFLAKNLKPSPLARDEHELLEVEKLPFKEAYRRVIEEQIPTAQVLIAFLMAKEMM